MKLFSNTDGKEATCILKEHGAERVGAFTANPYGSGEGQCGESMTTKSSLL
jgi:hypothetical protein